ncbi:Calmodulin-binding protein 60 E [Linum perenne]
MDGNRGRRVDKRGYEQSVEDEPESKKPKMPALASVIVEALKVDSLQRLCSSLEPLFRRIVSEEVERALSRMGNTKLSGRSSPPKLPGPGEKSLQLHFRTRMPPHLFTGARVEGEQGAAIHVVLIDSATGSVVQMGPESCAKLNVVVIEGDFNEEAEEDWTAEHFENYEVKEREGKRPLLTGDLQVVLKEGVGTLGDLSFTDNSSWIRSRKFRLGVKVAPGHCEGIRVREAKTESFAVKDHRGELYKKHYPPALHDEVWRLDRIAKDGALHKKLVKSQIVTVEDFLQLLVRDPQKLRSVLGSGMSNRMWENTVEHAKTCVLGGKLYVYYTDGVHSTGVVFNHICELRGLISEGQFVALESLDHNQKLSVDSIVKRAYENWHQVIEYDGKVLTALSAAKVPKKALPPPPPPTNYEPQQFISHNQNKQLYISPDPSSQCQPVNNPPQPTHLIDFPFARTDQNATSVSNHHHHHHQQASAVALPSNMDYMAVATPGGYQSGADWTRPRSGQGMEDFFAEELRLRSSEMLESDDMQRLLRSFGMGNMGNGGFGGHSLVHPGNDACYSYSIGGYEPQIDQAAYSQDRGRGGGKAVVGWLKLKAALRWGIFIRKRAAERRAQLVELD